MTDRIVYATSKPKYIIEESYTYTQLGGEETQSEWIAVSGFDTPEEAVREANFLQNQNPVNDYRVIVTERV